MKNLFLTTLIYLGVFITANAQVTTVPINSKITNATVFLSGAQVHRQTETIDVPAGVTSFVFTGLSSAIETQSIQAKGEGNFTILSVTEQQNFLLEKKNSEQKENYLNSITNLSDKITVLRNESDVYKAEEDMLIKNQLVMGPNMSYDLAKFKLALDFQKQRLTEAKNKQIEIRNQITKLQLELNKLNKQVVEIEGQSLKNSNDVVVKVSAKGATKGKFSLTYMVKNAGWYPTYDIRAKDVSSPIELVYKANVSQNSGEDWKNVKLTLSSGNPTNNNIKPELGTYSLGFLSAGYYGNGSTANSMRLARGRVVSANDNQALPGVAVRVNNTSVATVTDANGNFSLQIPTGGNMLTFNYIGFQSQELPISMGQMNVRLRQEEQMLQEVMVSDALQGRAAGVQVKKSQQNLMSAPLEVKTVEKQTNIIFDIQNPYTILSDGKQFTVDIGNYDFNANYEYYAAPKFSSDAYLTAKIDGFNDINLISGEANIFFEGTFLGKTLLDLQNESDTLTFSLGVDKNVVIKREKQKEFNEKQFIGSYQRDNRSFLIDIKNRKSQTINLIVQDQLPVSTNGEITIEKPEINGAQLDVATGILTWKMLLQSNEQKKLTLKYQVKYPKNKPVNIE